MIMKEIKGKDIEGYLWYSDRDTPMVYNGEKIALILNDDSNPFVIEGQLYDSNTNISYSIKYVDGRYFVKEYSIDEIKSAPKCEVVDKYFQSHRMGGKVLHLNEVWRPAPDSFCEGMEVLQPAELVFVGFKEEEIL